MNNTSTPDPSMPQPNEHGIERSVEQTSASAHEKIEQAADMLHPGVERLSAGAHQAVDRLAAVATQAGHKLDAKSAQFKDLHQKLTDECRVYVREKPATALALAALAGFVLSRLLRGR